MREALKGRSERKGFVLYHTVTNNTHNIAF
nr:MAG TPA: hypothetical protein [Bacteriophage sp.]DAV18982.1 MAG TPA: hypothetical protein [Bacteriophage sp.]